MSNLESLSNQWNDVVGKIRALGGSIRPGSVCAQNVKYRAKDGARKEHGPYPILTFKEKGVLSVSLWVRYLTLGCGRRKT